MIRGTFLVLGVWLGILWIAGLHNESTTWLTWLDGAVGFLALVTAVLCPEEAPARAVLAAPIALGTVIALFWIVGLASHATVWLTWWTLVIALAAFVVGGTIRVGQTHHRSDISKPV